MDNTPEIAPMAPVRRRGEHERARYSPGRGRRSHPVGADRSRRRGARRAQPRHPAGFRRRAVRACGPRGFRALPAGRTGGHRRAVVGVCSRSANLAPQKSASSRPRRSRAWRCSKSSTTTCRSWSTRSSARSVNAVSTSACWSTRYSRSSAARRESSTPSMGRTRAMAGAKASFTSMSMTTATPRRAPTLCARSPTSSPRCACACRIGGRCWRA